MSQPPDPTPGRHARPEPSPGETGFGVIAALLLYPVAVWGLAYRFEIPILDAVFLAALIVVLPALAVAQISLVAEARVERVPAYVASALTISALALAAAALGYRSGGWSRMGMGPVGLREWAVWSGWSILACGLVVLALHLLRKRARIVESPILKELIPRTAREKWVFVLLSLAAGVGEELVFRGYAIGALASVLGGLWNAAIFTSVVFGLLHAYQGPVGMVRTTLLGGLLAASFLLSGSLWPVVTAHVALDLLGGLVWGDRLSE
jgi:membrane protease YdiL (CAAX protease family)